jgi:hypothetical protein
MTVPHEPSADERAQAARTERLRQLALIQTAREARRAHRDEQMLAALAAGELPLVLDVCGLPVVGLDEPLHVDRDNDDG